MTREEFKEINEKMASLRIAKEVLAEHIELTNYSKGMRNGNKALKRIKSINKEMSRLNKMLVNA